MSALEPLAPDQRAVVSLVLQQGRSYDEIAALLGMPVDAVRARAQAGLAALARDNGLPPEVTGPLADYLLGQQRPADAEATRGLLADSEPARAWANDVAGRLEGMAPGRLAEIPAAAGARAEEPGGAAAPPEEPGGAAAPAEEPGGAAAPPGPRPRPVREAPSPAPGAESPPAASRLGGALLIAGVLAIVVIVIVLVLRGGGDDPAGEQAAATPSPAATATPSPSGGDAQVADTIRLRPPSGGDARGTMTLYLQEQQLLFALEAQGVPPSGPNAAYAVWFTGPGAKVRRLGFTNPVGEDGRLGIQGPSDKDLDAFPKLYATYERVVVSEETDENAKRPGKVILTGKLPQGR
jgi:Sigma-70, region 4